MAATLAAQGRYDAAAGMHAKALAINTAAAGRTHTALADVLDKQGKHGEALARLHDAKRMLLDAFGTEDHADVAQTYHVKGRVLKKLGELAPAMEMYGTALRIRRNLGLGESEAAANTYNNMANVYRRQGEPARALELFRKALAIYVKVLGEAHAEVARTYKNMALVHKDQGEPATALELHEKALAIELAALGPDHPEVALSYYNLGRLHGHTLDDWTAALDCFEKSVQIRRAKLGDDHQDTKAAAREVKVAKSKLA